MGDRRLAAPGFAAGLLGVAGALAGCAALQGDPAAEIAESLERIEAEREVAPPEPPAPARDASAERDPEAWVSIEQPRGGPMRTLRTGWVEVAGLAGTRESDRFDVVIVLDVSGSTRYASGADVDGDGVVGRRREVKPWEVFDPSADSSDPEDTVLEAELEATRRLVERLDPARTRIGLVSFSDLARPRAPLGASPELLGLVLDDLSGAFGAGPTDLAEATRLAVRMLRETGEDLDSAPEPVALILSDGYPTHPESEELAAAAALRAADEAAEAGVRLTTLSLGIDRPRDPDVFASMAHRTGGQHLRVGTPGDVVHALPAIDLARVAELRVENATTGEPARATRVGPDGRYDAWLRLAPGENRIRVTARGRDGGRARAERVVFYDDSAPDAEEATRIRKQIELRTLELELAREVRDAKRRRVIEIGPADPPR